LGYVGVEGVAGFIMWSIGTIFVLSNVSNEKRIGKSKKPGDYSWLF